MTFTFMLAPLEDTSDSALRSICHRYGADVTFTEMTRVESLARKNASTLKKIAFCDDTPAHIQIIGQNEQQLKRFLSDFEPPKSFLGFNFNLGCPSPNLTNNGLGSAMVKRISKTKKIVKVVQDRGHPVSLKIRLGLNAFEKKKKVYLNLIDAVDADFFAVHARVATDKYDTPADFSVYPELVATGKRIIANGDITTIQQVDLLKSMGLQGVMIGRSAVCDPTIFNKLKGISTPDMNQVRQEYIALAEQFDSRFKYRQNVLKRLGKPVSTLTKAEYAHVEG